MYTMTNDIATECPQEDTAIRYNNKHINEERGPCPHAFDHVLFYVSSPRVVAQYLVCLFGFHIYAYKGLETGSREVSATAVKNGTAILVFMGAVRPLHWEPLLPSIDSIHQHIAEHGDSVKDVAFQCSDLESLVLRIKSKRAEQLLISDEPVVVKDEYGTIKLITIRGVQDTVHTLVDRSDYRGFLPGFRLVEQLRPQGNVHENLIVEIDHCVQNEDWNQMYNVCQFYKDYLDFHVLWCVDERQVHTEYSALKSTVMASKNEIIKMPINEPAIGRRKSQIEEFVEFHNGPGVQHIALKTNDMIETIGYMRTHGVEFIDVPDKYYENLKKRLALEKHPILKEPLKVLKKHGILVDFDEKGYLLQLFTKSIFERPTFFFEIIQRYNHNGFGAGNFKGLFEVMEKDQEKRGNLTKQEISKGKVLK